MYIRFSNGSEILLVDVPIKEKFLDDVALIHLNNAITGINKGAWELVDIPTGLYICSGRTKKECIEIFKNDFAKKYLNFKTNNPRYYRLKVELQELIKAREEGGKKDG